MKIYGVPLSPFVRKTLFTLAELEQTAKAIEVAPHSDDSAFRKASPMGRIPAFSDGDFLIADSAAICRYLVTRERSELMGGPSPQRQARCVQWETWGDADLGPALTPALMERVVKPVRMGQTTDEAAVQSSIENRLPAVYETLDTALGERGPWLLGETFSYADIAIGSHMATAEIADVMPDEPTYPQLCAWFDRLRARDGYRAMLEQTNTYIERHRSR